MNSNRIVIVVLLLVKSDTVILRTSLIKSPSISKSSQNSVPMFRKSTIILKTFLWDFNLAGDHENLICLFLYFPYTRKSILMPAF